MFKFLKKHPFPVEAWFDSSLVLAFAVPKELLESMIPECLTLDTFEDKWAFVAVAMVQTKGLRPKGFPKFMGSEFFLIGYRVFVRYKDNRGKRLRGLYIIKSETNKKKMEFLGDIFTRYNYSTTDISQVSNGNLLTISSQKSDFEVVADFSEEKVALPADSPFANWKEARRFAGPLPFTFSYEKATKKVLIIQGVRSNWKPAPVKIDEHRFAFLDSLNLKGAVLANAFIIREIPYHWEKGKIETWIP